MLRDWSGRGNRKFLHASSSLEMMTYVETILWSRGSAERILGWDFYLGLAKLRRIAHKFLSEFFQLIFPSNFSACLSPGFHPHPPQKITHKIVGIPLQFQMFEPNTFFKPIFCLRGRPTYWNNSVCNNWRISCVIPWSKSFFLGDF